MKFKLRSELDASTQLTNTRKRHLAFTCWLSPPYPNTLLTMAPDIDFESSDILGGALPVGRGRVAQHSGFSSFFKICALGASTLLLLLAFRHGRTFFLRWKERHYKLYPILT
jgi:hypothetical protein